MQEYLSQISWQAPWLRHWNKTAEAVINTQKQLSDHSLVTALNRNKGPLNFQFVDQAELNEAFTYESFIQESKRIPTRQNTHDFLNGLSWIKYPSTKSSMLALQAAEVEKREEQNRIDSNQNTGDKRLQTGRGPVRDAITVFDENGVLLQADERLWSALEERDWQSLFIKHRALWSSAKVWIFGHALLEKLISPRPSMTGHVLRLKIPLDLQESQMDAWVSQHITQLNWATKPFTPLQVLGVPGWWPANEAPAFYADKQIFRPQSDTL